MAFFKPNRTNPKEILNHLLKNTPDISQKIMKDEFGHNIKNSIKNKKLPVFFVDDRKHPSDLLGYRYIPYLEKFKEEFDFFHLEGD
jgi:hypothetical protein